MIKRPTIHDTDDDLLKEQEEFLQAKKPSSKGKKVHFGESVHNTIKDSEIDDAFAENDSHISTILPEILEKEASKFQYMEPYQMSSRGFPTAPQIPDILETSGGGKKKSLFAQQFKRKGGKNFGMSSKSNKMVFAKENVMERDEVRMDYLPSPMMDASPGVSNAQLKSNDNDSDIHQENVNEIAKMSNQEILEKQKELLTLLGPETVSFLKNRGQKRPSDVEMQEKSSHQKISSEDVNHKCVQNESDDLPINVKHTKNIPHMNVVETEKLEWTKDLPPVKDSLQSGQQARFDFKGEIISSDTTLPTHLGLHHHGEEPERAGYTIGELFHLVRSANLQQKSFALHLLGKIIKNAYNGIYEDVASVPLIPAMLDGGLIFVLRWALDDKTESTMAAAVSCMNALIVCEADEESADSVRSWHNGLCLPSLCPSVPPKTDDSSIPEDEQIQQTDDDVCKEDLIKGLVRMLILERLRYLLHTWHPARPIVTHILQILVRFARHSTETAYQIVKCTDLLKIVVGNFLPHTWTNDNECYQYPNVNALKLMRIICSAGRHMSAKIISDYRVLDIISTYLMLEPQDMGLPLDEAISLHMECMSTWQTLATYGLASEQYSDLYSVMSLRLQAIVRSPPHVNNMCYPHVVSLMESFLHIAAVRQHDCTTSADDTAKPLVLPSLRWSHVDGLYPTVVLCLQAQSKYFMENFIQQKYDLSLFASCINFVASFVGYSSGLKSETCTTSDIETLCLQVILPLIQCEAFTYALKVLREESLLLNESKYNAKQFPSCLPVIGGSLQPSHKTAAVSLMVAISRLLLHVGQMHITCTEQLYQCFLRAPEFVQYLRRCCQVKQTQLTNHPFIMFDNLFQYHTTKMAQIVPKVCDIKLFHRISLWLFVRLQSGDEQLAYDLLSTSMFNGEIICLPEEELSNCGLRSLRLDNTSKLQCATQETASLTQIELYREAIKRTINIRSTFMKSGVVSLASFENSRALHTHKPLQINKLQRAIVGQTVVPLDWAFFPLVQLYCISQEIDHEKSLDNTLLLQVIDTLCWVYILETQQPDIMEHITLLTKISRIMCTFLAGTDFFLNKYVHMFLAGLLEIYCYPVYLDRMDFTKSIPGMSSFYDFYDLFIQQFESVSFGDSTFASYLLLPMQQCHPIELRRAVWGEHHHVLRSLFIPLAQVLIPVDRFLYPEEHNLELLRLYMQALLSSKVTPQRTPLPYLIALHHVNRFMYTLDTEHANIRMLFLTEAITNKNQLLRQHLIFYKNPNSDMEYFLELYKTLPHIRQATYDNVMKSI